MISRGTVDDLNGPLFPHSCANIHIVFITSHGEGREGGGILLLLQVNFPRLWFN